MDSNNIGILITIIVTFAGFIKWLFSLHGDSIKEQKKEIEEQSKTLMDHFKADDIVRDEYERNIYAKIDRLQSTVEASSERILEIQQSMNEEFLNIKTGMLQISINGEEIKKISHGMNNIGQIVKILVEKTKPLQEHYGKVLFLEKRFDELERKKKVS